LRLATIAATNGLSVSEDTFELACDRLSRIVDPTQFQRLVWARTEAPMLARLAELLHMALEDRPDFALSEEGSTKSVRRYVLKIHGNRIVGITLALHRGCAVLDAETIERSRFLIKAGDPLADDFDLVDEAWMAAALPVLFERIDQVRREPEPEPQQTQQSRAEAAPVQAPVVRARMM
jgi:hypothetical protein